MPAPFAGLRVWRNTDVANGGALDLAPGILGYEWNTSPEDDLRPAGLIKLSDTTIPWGSILIDQGNQVAPGVATHNLSLYRAESGALVFGAGTVFWSWALSDLHDGSPYGAQIANRDIQQFTINMFADMGIQPGVSDAILQSQGLVRALASTDFAAATTAINDLPDETPALGSIVITGTATDNDGNPADGRRQGRRGRGLGRRRRDVEGRDDHRWLGDLELCLAADAGGDLYDQGPGDRRQSQCGQRDARRGDDYRHGADPTGYLQPV